MNLDEILGFRTLNRLELPGLLKYFQHLQKCVKGETRLISQKPLQQQDRPDTADCAAVSQVRCGGARTHRR